MSSINRHFNKAHFSLKGLVLREDRMLIKEGEVPFIIDTFLGNVKHGRYHATMNDCNILIALGMEHQMPEKAEEVLRFALEQGHVPGRHTYLILANGYAFNGNVEKTKQVLIDMKEAGHPGDAKTFWSVIDKFAGRGGVIQAFELFKVMEQQGIKPTQNVFSLLVRGFMQVGQVNQALYMVHLMRLKRMKPNDLIYSVLVMGFLRNGMEEEAYQTLFWMRTIGMPPSQTVYFNLLKHQFAHERLENALKLLEMAKEDGLTSPLVFGTAVSGLMKRGMFEKAEQIFRDLKARGGAGNLQMYTSLIHGYFKLGHHQEAVRLLSLLHESGFKADVPLCNALMDGLCASGLFDEAKDMLATLISNGSNPEEPTYATLMTGYFKFGRVNDALEIWNKIVNDFGSPGVISRTSLMSGYFLNHMTEEALEVFESMRKDKAMINVVTYNALIQGFKRNGMPEKLKDVLEMMKKDGIEPNELTHRQLLRCYHFYNLLDLALEQFNELVRKGFNVTVDDFNNVIDLLCKHDQPDTAKELLHFMRKRNVQHNALTFQRLVDCYFRQGRVEEVSALVPQLGSFADRALFMTLLRGFSHYGFMDKAEMAMKRMFYHKIQPNVASYLILVKGYLKVGLFENALETFRRIRNPEFQHYSTFINELVTLGMEKEAKQLYIEMREAGISDKEGGNTPTENPTKNKAVK